MLTVPLLSTAALVSAGITPAELRRRSGVRGDLVSVVRGVYVDRSVWESADRTARHLLMARAVLGQLAADSVISHGSAAAVHDLATLRVSLQTVHVTRPGLGTGKRRSSHLIHGCALADDEIVSVAGMRVTSTARTVIDVTRSDGWLPGLVVADQALRVGCTADELRAAAGRQRALPGSACLDRLIDTADAGADNPGETLARAVLLDAIAGLTITPGQVETQFLVQDDVRRAAVDLRIGRLLIEFDGRWKYARDRPFGDGSPPSDVLWNEKVREDWLRSFGFTVLRLTWDDIWGAARPATVARLREAVVRHSGVL